MGRADRAPIAGVFCASASTAREGASIELGADAAQHVRVRRMRAGDALRVHDGTGRVAWGTLASVERRGASVGVERVEVAARPAPIHLLVPVADRDRMLWLAEKAVELGLASWRPVRWVRSRSVAGRGEGSGFAEKLRARMAAALVQSEGAWLPELHADAVSD
ncbi:MAG TPA: 16S rRNA (uracil(1498)-N(3))-methyltransferase, partial [Gemmatimonadaceae bacterium]|nr:16S rRNA (uracil(1498)-N(3))-methyltransferase [Gemmatimonadaceae bacterium]